MIKNMEDIRIKFQKTGLFYKKNTRMIKVKNYGSVYIYKMKQDIDPTINQYLYLLFSVTKHLAAIDEYESDKKQEIAGLKSDLNNLIKKKTFLIRKIPFEDELGMLFLSQLNHTKLNFLNIYCIDDWQKLVNYEQKVIALCCNLYPEYLKCAFEYIESKEDSYTEFSNLRELSSFT